MSDIRYLFRFRDLVAPTIEEHRRVIAERGWCWWGWWKRPSEDDRSDIWNHLLEETKEGRSVDVGLYDVGNDHCYLATVSGVIKPTGSASPVKVPDDQADHVPSYYRTSPFSRAWMKLTAINEAPIEFFGYYSFAEAPKLPNYASATLKRFVGKKIVGPEELRGMDTTIWRIRPSLDADPAERILLSVQALSEPISADIVRCRSDRILHLTDVHFAMDNSRSQHVWRLESETLETRHTMVEAVASALNNRKIGIVIVSGDFAFIGSEAEFEEARRAIARLLGILDLSPDHLIIIPGNHDIRWSTDAVYDSNATISQAPPEARANYQAFYRTLMRHDPGRHLSMGRRYALPCGQMVEICALNSSSLEQGKNFLAGMGKIDQAAFAETAQGLGWDDRPSAALRLLVVHHHLALTEDLEPADGYGKGYGLAVDAVRVQRMAADKGVHLALHGHKHRSFLWRSTVYAPPEFAAKEYRLGELSIIGGGSAGSSETEAFSNFFNVIDLSPGKLTLEIFRSQKLGTFDLINVWEAKLALDEGGLKMGDWSKVR